MKDKHIKDLNSIGDKKLVEELPREICSVVLNKGLTYAQARALLEYAKDLLKQGAKITT